MLRDITPLPVIPNPATPQNIYPEDIATCLTTLNGAYHSEHLYARYTDAALMAGHRPGSKTHFCRRLAALGYKQWRTATSRGWIII